MRKEPLERATCRIGGLNAPTEGASRHARPNTATLSVSAGRQGWSRPVGPAARFATSSASYRGGASGGSWRSDCSWDECRRRQTTEARCVAAMSRPRKERCEGIAFGSRWCRTDEGFKRSIGSRRQAAACTPRRARRASSASTRLRLKRSRFHTTSAATSPLSMRAIASFHSGRAASPPLRSSSSSTSTSSSPRADRHGRCSPSAARD